MLSMRFPVATNGLANPRCHLANFFGNMEEVIISDIQGLERYVIYEPIKNDMEINWNDYFGHEVI